VSNKSRSAKASLLPSVSEDKEGMGIEEAAQEELKNEGFVVEIFLDDNHQVTSTQVLHVKRNEGESWAGWDERRLIGFLARHAGIAHDEIVTSKNTAGAAHANKARGPEVEVAVHGLAVRPTRHAAEQRGIV
jgi:hypothetical protein